MYKFEFRIEKNYDKKRISKDNCDTTPFRKLGQNVRNGQAYLQPKIIFEIGKIYLH